MQEDINKLLMQSITGVMNGANERLSIRNPRLDTRARLRQELIQDSPIIVLDRRLRRIDYIQTFEDLKNPATAGTFNGLIYEVEVVQRWIRRFGAKSGNWRQ